MRHSYVSILVASTATMESTSLKYLGLFYGPGKWNTHMCKVEHTLTGFFANCAKPATIKCNCSKRMLSLVQDFVAH